MSRHAPQSIELAPDMESIALLMNDSEFLRTDQPPIEQVLPHLVLYTYEPTDGAPTFTAADLESFDASHECMMDAESDDERTDDWCR
jgi:hypothetical protein